MQHNINAADIGLRFVKEYYGVLCSTPNKMHHFYCDTSEYTYAMGSQDPATVKGKEQIFSKIAELGFDDVRVDFESGSIDTQPSQTDGNVMVMVTGTFSMKGLPPKPFVQTMLLARRSGGESVGFYVVNDVCRVLDKKALLASCEQKVHGRNRDSAEDLLEACDFMGGTHGEESPSEVPIQNQGGATVGKAASGKNARSATSAKEIVAATAPGQATETAASAPAPLATAQEAAVEKGGADASAAGEHAAVESKPGQETAEAPPKPAAAPKPKPKPAVAAVVTAPEPVVAKKPASFKDALLMKKAQQALKQPPASRLAPKRAPPAAVGNSAAGTAVSADAPITTAKATASTSSSGTARSNERKPARRSEGASVFVRNIAVATEKDQVRSIYERFGSISTVHLKGERGYGFFEYSDAMSVQKALAAQGDGSLKSPFTIEERRESGRGRGSSRFPSRRHDEDRRESGARRGGRRGGGAGSGGRGRGRVGGRGR